MFDQLLAALAALQEQVVALQAGQEAALQAKYDEGFAAGLAAGGSDKIYSQAEADSLVAAAVAPLQAKVDELQAKVDEIPAQIEAALASLRVELKAQFKALVMEQKQVEDASEQDLADKIDQL